MINNLAASFKYLEGMMCKMNVAGWQCTHVTWKSCAPPINNIGNELFLS